MKNSSSCFFVSFVSSGSRLTFRLAISVLYEKTVHAETSLRGETLGRSDHRTRSIPSDLSSLNKGQIAERGARMARRDD